MFSNERLNIWTFHSILLEFPIERSLEKKSREREREKRDRLKKKELLIKENNSYGLIVFSQFELILIGILRSYSYMFYSND